MSIEIQLKDYGNLELFEDVNVPLIFNVDDIKNFGKRTSNFSKTITIPGTKNNNIIFKYIYEIKSTGGFNMTTKHDCILLVDKNPIIVGFIKLNNITNDDGVITYEVNIFDQVKNLFVDLGELNLRDLDFSSGFTFKDNTYYAGDHTYDIPTIRNNFYTVGNYNGVYDYTLINHGYSVKFGEWPWKSISLSQLYPSVYVKAIIDKIFYDAGWTYSSDFLDGTTYDGIIKKIISNYNGNKIYTNVNLSMYLSTSWENGQWPYANFPPILPLNQEYNDNLFGERYYKYEIDDSFVDDYYMTIPKDGLYDLKLYVDVFDGRTHGSNSEYTLMYKRFDTDTSGYTHFTIQQWLSEDFTPDIIISEIKTVENYELEAGDLVYFTLDTAQTPGHNDFNLNCIALETIFKIDEENFTDYKGTTIPLNQFLPDMKQADFLRNIIKLNNLYLWTDKTDNNEKLLHIDPRDEFYSDGSIVDWTNKVNYFDKIKISDLIGDISKEMNFQYNKNNDYYSKQFEDEYTFTYGTKKLELDNNYLKGKTDIKVDFTSLQFYYDLDGGQGNTTAISSRTKTLNDDWFDEIETSNPYIGFTWSYSYNEQQSNLNLGGGDTNDNLFRIQYSTHIFSHAGSWWDLNFETTKMLIDTPYVNLNDKNMYNVFWKNYVENITDIDTRRVEYGVNLTLTDIIKLDFRNYIQIDGQYYILEKLEYDPTKNGSSKVTLLKMKEVKEGEFIYDYVLYNDVDDYVLYNDDGDRIYYK